MSFDKIFDLTAGVYFYFYNTNRRPKSHINTYIFCFLWGSFIFPDDTGIRTNEDLEAL